MISVTFLSGYIYCARRLFIEQVLGIKPEIPKEALVKGSIRHKVYEKINLSEEGIVKSIDRHDFDFVREKYSSSLMQILRKTILSSKESLKSVNIPLADFFAQTKPLIENEAERRAERIFSFMSSTGLLGGELWQRFTPKTKPEYRVYSEAVGLKGVIDELEVHEGYVVPVELKTGKAPSEGVWPGHRIQVGAYAMLLEDAFGVKVKNAVVRYLDANISRNVAVNPFLREEVKELVKKVNKLLESDKMPGFPSNGNKCRACDLKEVCFKKTKDLNRT